MSVDAVAEVLPPPPRPQEDYHRAQRVNLEQHDTRLRRCFLAAALAEVARRTRLHEESWRVSCPSYLRAV